MDSQSGEHIRVLFTGPRLIRSPFNFSASTFAAIRSWNNIALILLLSSYKVFIPILYTYLSKTKMRANIDD